MSPAIPPWKYQFSFDHWSQACPGVVSTWMGDRLGIVTLFFIIHLLYIRLNVLPYPKDHLYLWPTSTFSIVQRVVHYYRRLYSLYKNKGHFIISNKPASCQLAATLASCPYGQLTKVLYKNCRLYRLDKKYKGDIILNISQVQDNSPKRPLLSFWIRRVVLIVIRPLAKKLFVIHPRGNPCRRQNFVNHFFLLPQQILAEKR